MSLEDDIRRQMESEAAAQQIQPQCPIGEDVDAAFGFNLKKEYKRDRKALTKQLLKHKTSRKKIEGTLKAHRKSHGM